MGRIDSTIRRFLFAVREWNSGTFSTTAFPSSLPELNNVALHDAMTSSNLALVIFKTLAVALHIVTVAVLGS